MFKSKSLEDSAARAGVNPDTLTRYVALGGYSDDCHSVYTENADCHASADEYEPVTVIFTLPNGEKMIATCVYGESRGEKWMTRIAAPASVQIEVIDTYVDADR